ncbi:hypothetical protein DDF62_22380 [Caulobacter radicis]|nr:hypothetical protein DDF62_22380 [Caulobacter radicis]
MVDRPSNVLIGSAVGALAPSLARLILGVAFGAVLTASLALFVLGWLVRPLIPRRRAPPGDAEVADA